MARSPPDHGGAGDRYEISEHSLRNTKEFPEGIDESTWLEKQHQLKNILNFDVGIASSLG